MRGLHRRASTSAARDAKLLTYTNDIGVDNPVELGNRRDRRIIAAGDQRQRIACLHNIYCFTRDRSNRWCAKRRWLRSCQRRIRGGHGRWICNAHGDDQALTRKNQRGFVQPVRLNNRLSGAAIKCRKLRNSIPSPYRMDNASRKCFIQRRGQRSTDA